ncbi:MAG: hypothetical protein L0Z50_05670 [Verrucomicrobiales bacterium]|nr:hypothetical protein [Verrucomicrobiales bacterium]
MPYQGFDERMDRLETVLTSFIRHADETMVELRQELRQDLAERRQDTAEMRQWRIQAQKQWGEIAQKLG